MRSRPLFAERRLRVIDQDGNQCGELHIEIYKPEELPEKGGYACAYKIDGMNEGRIKDARGEDSVQALIHTLAKIGAELYSSSYYAAGSLDWCGDPNLGFPVFFPLEDKVPNPHRMVL